MEETKRINYTEPELLSGVRLGSRFAFEQLYHLHRPVVLSYLRRLIRDDDLAKEILQDVFLKVWEKRGMIDPSKSFPAYLFRIARNLVMDFYRKARRDKQLADNLQIFAIEVNEYPMESTISRDEEELLLRAIERLSPQRKKIFMLCKLEGKSYDEVGQMLGISSSTISDHIVKATKYIRNQLVCQVNIACILFVPMMVESIHDILRKLI